MEIVGIIATVIVVILAVFIGIPVLLLNRAARQGRNPFN